MGLGVSNFSFSKNFVPSVAPPVLALDNGLHIDGTTGKLGGTLIEQTDIDLGGNIFSLTDSFLQPYFTLFPESNTILKSFQNPNGSFLQIQEHYIFAGDNVIWINIDGNVNSFEVVSNHNSQLLADATNFYYSFGDKDFVNNNSFLEINDAVKTFKMISTGGYYFLIDVVNNLYQFGDVNNSVFSAYFEIDAAAQTFAFLGQFGLQYLKAGTNGITTNAVNFWSFGAKTAGAVAFDAANYLNVTIDGVVYKIALAT